MGSILHLVFSSDEIRGVAGRSGIAAVVGGAIRAVGEEIARGEMVLRTSELFWAWNDCTDPAESNSKASNDVAGSCFSACRDDQFSVLSAEGIFYSKVSHLRFPDEPQYLDCWLGGERGCQGCFGQYRRVRGRSELGPDR
jgi:hypothetical protein